MLAKGTRLPAISNAVGSMNPPAKPGNEIICAVTGRGQARSKRKYISMDKYGHTLSTGKGCREDWKGIKMRKSR
ncbi:hypothetical protein M378DRAFT_173808 [Amanita muscaria Koide BX008]|uniref:Uncharacterized protein n=1 Tax=Amanita muscaria (strain Koide BX008) TaxID=946122 RepID=A0A0C2W283_AMAMK|nr:hypothetical protein M378DRAFT_173808 [Amanita muscaria Koide BX008]